jgi:hypothetical protein
MTTGRQVVEVHVPQWHAAGDRGLPIEWNFAVEQWAKARREKVAGSWWGDPVIFSEDDTPPRRALIADSDA